MKIHQISHVIFETTSQFFFNFASLSNVIGDKSSVLLWLKLYVMVFTKGAHHSAKFRLLTTQVKFHQIWTSIGSFCWKYIKFQLKKYGRNISDDTKDWSKIWRKIYFLFQKSLKNFHFDWSLLWKVYNVWPKNVQRIYISWRLQKSRKIWRKTDLWFGKWHEEFDKFSSEHLKVSKLVFSWDPFVRRWKCISYKLTEEL